MITLGSDPEFMLHDADGQLKSAIGIVPGTKDERYDLGDGHYMYYDNVLAECNIRPGSSKEQAIENFKECFQRFAGHIAPVSLVVQASAQYPSGELEHEKAKEFGCDPEFCAYSVSVIEPPQCPDTFRSAGGHVHIGYDGGVDPEDDDDEELKFKIAWDRIWVIRMADIILGISSLYLDKDPTSRNRRQLYGLAGSHRACEEWGVEYRAMGNFWLMRPSLVGLIYDLSDCCVKLGQDEELRERIWSDEIDPDNLRETINNWDMRKANKYLKIIQRHVPGVVWDQFLAEMKVDRHGTTKDFYEKWELES
jgi:hypothetical protein